METNEEREYKTRLFSITSLLCNNDIIEITTTDKQIEMCDDIIYSTEKIKKALRKRQKR